MKMEPRLGFEPRTFALPRRRFCRLLQRSNQAELPRHDELAQLDNLLTFLEYLLNFVHLFLQLLVKFLHGLLVLGMFTLWINLHPHSNWLNIISPFTNFVI